MKFVAGFYFASLCGTAIAWATRTDLQIVFAAMAITSLVTIFGACAVSKLLLTSRHYPGATRPR